MSLADGWAALNLEMPPRVPRTEYSAEGHWELVKAVTGIQVSQESNEDTKRAASGMFVERWNYDLFWAILIDSNCLGGKRAKMGHAVYAAGGIDYSDEIGCPFKSVEEVLQFDFEAEFPIPDKATAVRKFENHYREQVAAHPDGVNMTGIYVTCISGLIETFGWEMLLLAAGSDAERFGELTNRYGDWVRFYFDALAEADVPVVMVHDDIVWTSGAFLRPDWYRRYVFPNYKKNLRPLIESGKKVLYTSDGDYTAFIDDVAACGVHGFVMEPCVDMRVVAERYGRTRVLIGNADTRVLLSGTKAAIRAEVQRCMDIGKKCPGFFMAVGNHIPANTPVDNAIFYNQVYEELSRR